jgi:hypothetical protein
MLVGRFYPTVATVKENVAVAVAGDHAPEKPPEEAGHFPNPSGEFIDADSPRPVLRRPRLVRNLSIGFSPT